LSESLDLAAVHRDIHQHRSARNVHVPDAVVHQLIVPLSFAGLEVDGDDALSEQAIARTMAAVKIAGGQLDWKVGHPKLLVDADLAPHASVAGVIGRIIFPSVIAEFAGFGDGMEDPQPLSGANIESANEAFHIGLTLRYVSGLVGRADDDDIARNDGC